MTIHHVIDTSEDFLKAVLDLVDDQADIEYVSKYNIQEGRVTTLKLNINKAMFQDFVQMIFDLLNPTVTQPLYLPNACNSVQVDYKGIRLTISAKINYMLDTQFSYKQEKSL